MTEIRWLEIMGLIRGGVLKTSERWVVDNALFLHVSGSRLYGTDTPQSDWDIRGVTFAPKRYWVGNGQFEQFATKVGDLDVVIWDFRKWLHLVAQMNPSVVETLFVEKDSECVLKEDLRWRRIVERILPLLNRRAVDSFRGYAHSQIQNLVSEKPSRKEIVDKFGFDTKFASHGFRVIQEGIELLTTGNIIFPRRNSQQLRDIRDGKVYRDHQSCVEDWHFQASKLDQVISILPDRADPKEIDRILIDFFDGVVEGREGALGFRKGGEKASHPVDDALDDVSLVQR